MTSSEPDIGRVLAISFASDSAYEALSEQLLSELASHNPLIKETQLMTPAALPPEFHMLGPPARHGFGLWAWKPSVVRRALALLRPGDVLLYADGRCACSGHLPWLEEFVRSKDGAEVVCMNVGDPERVWTKADVLAFLAIAPGDPVAESRHIAATAFAVKKCARVEALLAKWEAVVLHHPKMLSFECSSGGECAGFVRHGNDQSWFSLLLKTMLDDAKLVRLNSLHPLRLHAKPHPAPATRRRVDIVVAHFKEDISWAAAPELAPLVMVYHKCASELEHVECPPRQTMFRAETWLPNVGREGHTYLSHILATYDDLADVTVFTQGHPFDHAPRFLHQVACIREGHCATQGFWQLSAHTTEMRAFTDNPPFRIPVEEMCRAVFADPPPNFRYGNGALFAVPRHIIRCRTKEFYARLLEFVSAGNNPVEGHALERMWRVIFDPAVVENGATQKIPNLPVEHPLAAAAPCAAYDPRRSDATFLSFVLQLPSRLPILGECAFGAGLRRAKWVPGIVVECGVGGGGSLRRIAAAFSDRRCIGFDSFRGNPETWTRGDGAIPAGAFSCGGIPPAAMPPNVEIVPGQFRDTVQAWAARQPAPARNAVTGTNENTAISFLHVDCDTYGSTRTALAALAPLIGPRCVIAFDELVNYPGAEDHELKALFEVAREHGWIWQWIGCEVAAEPFCDVDRGAHRQRAALQLLHRDQIAGWHAA